MPLLTSMWGGRSALGLALTGWIAGACAVGVAAAGGPLGDAQGSSPGVEAAGRALPPGLLTAQGTVESITGTVVRARTVQSRRRAAGRPSQIQGGQFLLEAAKETVTVRAGPFRYRRREGFEIHAGDDLQVKGWRLRTPGKAIIVAGEIKKGSRVLKLRDDRGRPLWLIGGMEGRHPGRRPAVIPRRAAPKKGGTPSERPDDAQ